MGDLQGGVRINDLRLKIAELYEERDIARAEVDRLSAENERLADALKEIAKWRTCGEMSADQLDDDGNDPAPWFADRYNALIETACAALATTQKDKRP